MSQSAISALVFWGLMYLLAVWQLIARQVTWSLIVKSLPKFLIVLLLVCLLVGVTGALLSGRPGFIGGGAGAALWVTWLWLIRLGSLHAGPLVK